MNAAWKRMNEASRAAMIATYSGPVLSFAIRPPYYLASCDACGWVGSSEACGTDTMGDDSDVYCPRCSASGADCGKVAELIAPAVDVAARNLRATLEEEEAVAFMLRWRRRSESASAAKPICGQVFMNAATAEAAAKRMTNKWRLVEPFPVFAKSEE